jgi:uridine phosphorylase
MTDFPIPILDFDPNPAAILNPDRARIERAMPAGKLARPMPQSGVLCFFHEVLARLEESGKIQRIGSLISEMGTNPIYDFEMDSRRLFIAHPGVGAPLAVGFLEELIALGGKRFVACGGCGVLQKEIGTGHPVVITGAVRDEGTSYHYLPAEQEALPDPTLTVVLEKTLKARGVEYLAGKSWTTDAIYRETEGKRAKRVAEGCLVVEMEAAAFFAVAQFRGVSFAQLVYGGDMVVPEGWLGRGWNKRQSIREALFWLAIEAALSD